MTDPAGCRAFPLAVLNDVFTIDNDFSTASVNLMSGTAENLVLDWTPGVFRHGGKRDGSCWECAVRAEPDFLVHSPLDVGRPVADARPRRLRWTN